MYIDFSVQKNLRGVLLKRHDRCDVTIYLTQIQKGRFAGICSALFQFASMDNVASTDIGV